MHDASRGKPQSMINTAHPIAVTLGQIVVDSHDVHAFAFQGIKINCQG